MNIFDETNLWIRLYGSMFIPMSWRGRPIEMLKGIFVSSTQENLQTEEIFFSPKKMTAHQAAEELKFACENAPKTFSAFGVKAINFEDLWNDFGNRIQNHGMAYGQESGFLYLDEKDLTRKPFVYSAYRE